MSAKQLDEEGLFHAARRIADPDARALFLSQACGDNAALAGRVRALLEMHEQEPDSVEPPENVTANYEPIAERPGSMIGPYKLKEQIGEGGFGLVFVAEQTEPVKRKVALKIIKPGMDSRQVIARFEAERQALALMDHPNIAKVLDAGTTSGEPGGVSLGRPYFVMELVRGIPITEYCDKNQLAPKERLELFVTVCQAIQHAHQKGVIHRDVKPSNVLVTSHDGKPVAKVIDFGVAKAIHQQLTERSIYTNFAQMVGTPLYMSPEQAEMSGLDIDTRSDIYSLGVLLYELLTGTTPLEKRRFAAAAFDEMRRLIREEEPPKPSARLNQSTAILPSVAAQRHTEPSKLFKLVRGDLDWITMKALEKDRTRRYETANGFAADVLRYLSGEPVLAHPPSTAYRLKKFVRRNRPQVIAASMIVGIMVLGLVATSHGFIRATRERERANAAEKIAIDNERAAIQNQARAEKEAERATAVAALLRQMLETANPDSGGHAGITVRDMLDRFAAGLGDRMAGQPTVEAEVREVIGRAYWRLSLIDDAELHLRRAVELRRSAGDASRTEFAEALAAWSRVLASHRRVDEARAAASEAIALYRQIGGPPDGHLELLVALQWLVRDRVDESAKLVEEGRRLAATLPGGKHPALACLLHDRSGVLVDCQRIDEALAVAREAYEMHRQTRRSKDVESGWGAFFLAKSLRHSGQHVEAERLALEALGIFRSHFPDGGYDGTHHARIELIAALRGQGKHSEADALLAEADRWGRDNERVRSKDGWLGWADALASMREWERAVDGYLRASALAERSDRLEQFRTGFTLHHVGLSFDAAGQHAHALPIHRRAIELFDRAGASAAGELQANRRATAYAFLGECLHRLGRNGDAIAPLQVAIDGFGELFRANPKNLYHLREQAWFTIVLSAVLEADGKSERAIETLRTAIGLHERLVAESPAAANYRDRLAVGRVRLIRLLVARNRPEEVGSQVSALLESADGPSNVAPEMQANTLAVVGFELINKQMWADAERILRRCQTMREKVQPDAWNTFNSQSMLGAALFGQKKYAEAEPLLVKGYEGIKAREKSLPKGASNRIVEAIDRLIDLYTATNRPDQVKKYNELREKYPHAKK
jgi:serine/threonine protein kinase